MNARSCSLAQGQLSYLEGTTQPASDAVSGRAASPTLVLLHGIGSCAASWRAQLHTLAATWRIIAWDAPGYGGSTPLPQDEPLAKDYAEAAWSWLQALDVGRFVLIGHSLGALIAAALARRALAAEHADPQLEALVLASPAQGYADASAEIRTAKYRERVNALASLGAAGLAEQRSARLCSPHASAEAIEQVRVNMAQVQTRGYGQASWMLSNDSIHTYLADVLARRRLPTQVVCGSLDVITPPEAAARLAARHALPYRELPGLGHACYIENSSAFNDAVLTALSPPETHAYASAHPHG